jgi:hypothetical protein
MTIEEKLKRHFDACQRCRRNQNCERGHKIVVEYAAAELQKIAVEENSFARPKPTHFGQSNLTVGNADFY